MMKKKPPTTSETADREAEKELARIVEEQGVKPLTKEMLDAMGDVWPENESVDEFLAFRREQRRLAPRRELP